MTIDKPKVGNTGALTFSYPISADGPNGLTPDIDLSYSSQNNRDEGLGLGWSMNIPKIERDTAYGSNRLYSEDHFLSSARESWSRFPPVSTGPSGKGRFPKYEYASVASVWTATAKDGTRYVYGKTPPSG